MEYQKHNDPDGEALAKYRVWKPGGIEYLAMRMNDDQIRSRRIYLKKILIAYPSWEKLSNEQLNDIRVYRVNNGYIAEDPDGNEYFLSGKAITRDETEFRRVRAMMPFEFLNLMGADFQWDKYKSDTTAARDMVNNYILRFPQFREKGMGLYIYSGTKGSGKTMLSCCLINEIAKRYKGSVKFVNILDFLEMTKKSYDGDTQDRQAIHEAGLLVIDDIGVQMSKEWIDTVLYSLVNDRYVNRPPTVFTSNIPPECLKMDDRIIDRIENTTYNVKLPEEAIRRSIRQLEKKKLLNEIENGPWIVPTIQGQKAAEATKKQLHNITVSEERKERNGKNQ